jgi:ubiquitin thioesterase protein OTUB1
LSVNLPHSGYSTYFSYPQTRKPANPQKKKNLGLRAAEDLHAMHLPDASLSHVSPYYNPFHQHDYLAASRSPSSFIPSSIPTLVDLSRDSNLRFPAMESLSREELERFQKLSNEYEPNVQGPLVSAKRSTHAISAEYSNADPTLVTKTSALVVTHPFSRIMKGDGNCGWRAVAFGYFESLFTLRDPARVQQETTRIKSLSRLLDQVGQQEHLYEIFVEATEEVMMQILNSIQKRASDETFLVEAFNNEYNSNAIITHFRLLTSAWMKLNAVRYQSFLPAPLEQYCASRIETVKTEIDEVGLQALVDGVISSSGIAVEILYLDRSEGSTVTPHMLSANPVNVATIRLLYRPGHYDLLYGAESPIVNYATTSNYIPWDQGALSFDANPHLMAIPNLMADPFLMGSAVPASYQRNVFYPSSPPPPSQAQTQTQTQPQSQNQSQPRLQTQTQAQPPPTMTSPSISPTQTHPLTSLPNKPSDGPQIRLNPLVMKPNLSHSLPVTTPFKK